MTSLQIFGVQLVLSLIVYALIARWYIVPRLALLPLSAAMTPFLLAHALRGIGLAFLVPVVADPKLPSTFAQFAAYGDLLTALLALISLIALRSNWRIAFGLVWIVNLVGTADLLNGLVQGAVNDFTSYQLGVIWFIPTFLVPAYLVIHAVAFTMLVQRQGEYRSAKDRVQSLNKDNIPAS